jgi:hypothetical protein
VHAPRRPRQRECARDPAARPPLALARAIWTVKAFFVRRQTPKRTKGTAMTEGSCLCGAVRYTVAAPFGAATACHCGQCRRQSGHFWASADVPKAALALTGADVLRW